MAVLLGLVIGTLIATVMGRVNWGAVGQGPIFEFPQPFFFGAPQFAIGVIVSMCIVILVIMAETTADLLAVGEILGTKIDKKRIAAGLRADMGATAISPVFNGFPISAFAQNVGMVAMTGIKSRFVVAAGGGILVLLGLLPVLGRVMNAIPLPVLGRRRHRAVRVGRRCRHPHAEPGRTSPTRTCSSWPRRSASGSSRSPCPRSTTTSRSGWRTIFESGHQRDGDLRGAPEPRVQPLLEGRRAGARR